MGIENADEVSSKFFVDAAGNFIGVFVGAEPPEGSVEVPTLPADVRQTWNGTAWSAVPAVPLGPTAKADLWRRATDVEAAQMDAALAGQTPRLRRIYDSATLITREDELFTTLRDGLVGLFGATRADELLAPSTP